MDCGADATTQEGGLVDAIGMSKWTDKGVEPI
jgi:hypothetical protein